MGKKVVTLFGGSSRKILPSFGRAAEELGRAIAREGWTLRTGGGKGTSVMGRAADGALEAGGRVEGVILARFHRARHDGLTSMRTVETYPRRKAGLLRNASAVIAFPGGIGTMDEWFETLAMKQSGFLPLPIVLLNLEGFYDPLLAWLRESERKKISSPEIRKLYHAARTVRGTISFLRRAISD
jgi:uncharacterized protein (TIGR00730 family)